MLRSIVRPLTRTLRSHPSTSLAPFPAAFTSLKPRFHLLGAGSVGTEAPWFPIANHFHSLTDTRFPKRRPSDKPRRKRASLRPPGSLTCISLKFRVSVYNVLFTGSSMPRVNGFTRFLLNAGPYAWVQYTPGEPILPNQPNEGSVKRRNEKKRIRLRRAFILVRMSCYDRSYSCFP